MTVGVGDVKVNIPVLPKLPVVQGLTSLGIKDGHLLIKVDNARKLSFRCFVQNVLLPDDAVKAQSAGTYSLDLKSMPKLNGRSYLRVFASDGKVLMNDLLIPLDNGTPVTATSKLTRHDAHAQVLYSVLVDRFNNGNTANDAPLNSSDVDPRVDYKGGDLKGITLKIADGFFDSLGINTLWISPITQNPKDAWGQYIQ